VDLRVAALGRPHRLVAEALNSVALMMVYLVRLEEALVVQQQALECCRQTGVFVARIYKYIYIHISVCMHAARAARGCVCRA